MNRKGFCILLLLLASILSGCSDPNESSTSSPPPPAPKDLILKPIGPSHARLRWETTSTAQSRFVIRRSVNGGEFTQIAEVDSASREFVDDGVSPDVIYVYQVYAEGFFGKSAPVNSSEYTHPYLDACNTPLAPPSAPLHSFYDMPISGLNYRYLDSFSVTDNNGAFQWDQVSTVPFSLGYIDIGSLKSGDKAGLKTLNDNRGGTTVTLNNLLRLLMTLDEDKDSTNGIQLPCDISLAYGEINPFADYGSFSQQETVYRLTNGASLPSAEEASSRYVQYLFQEYVGHYELTWIILIDGIFPVSEVVSFDIDANGKIQNIADTVIDASVDPHNGYRLKIVDLAPLAFANAGYYKMEITGFFRPDQTFEGEVVIKNYLGYDLEGIVVGKRI